MGDGIVMWEMGQLYRRWDSSMRDGTVIWEMGQLYGR